MSFFNLDIGLGDIVDKVASYIPNQNERNKMKYDLEIKLKAYAQELALAQIKNNQIEASHKSIWVAGWRPFIGWVCGVGVAWAFVLLPLLSWVAVVCFDYKGVLPEPDIMNLIALLTAMLGIQGIRSFDKKNKVA